MNEEHNNQKYKEIIDQLKSEKMDWDFNDFLKSTENLPQKEDEAPIIPIEKNASKKMVKFWWAAAAIVIFSLGFFGIKWMTGDDSPQENDKLVAQEIQKQKLLR